MMRLTPVHPVWGVLALLLATGCSSASTGSPGPVPPPVVDPVEETAGEPQEVVGQDGTDAVVARPVVYGVDLDTIHAGRFDQGKMWTFEFPPTDYLRSEYGIEADSAWYRKARLGALRLSNCSASFVSPNGLVMTNHHCAREAVSQVSEEEENLLDEGFYARSLDEEREVEDFHADQLVEILDITDRVEERTAGLAGINLTEARADVLDAIAEEIQEERGGEEAGWVVEPISLYNGAHFSAYVFRRYENAKLVMAPELQIGFFGGDPDNFTYPRYNLDFSFFRLYDDDGNPLQNDVHFDWASEGVSEGDPIFVIGNPGSTSRLQSVAELEYRRDIGDRSVLEFIRSRAEVLRSFIDAFPDVAEEYDLRNSLFGLLNQEKAMVGQIEGLQDPVILARRQAAQEELLDSLRNDPELMEEFGTMYDEMREIQDEGRALAPGFGSFLALTSGELASPTLYRALITFQVLNLQQNGARSEQIAGLLEELREVGNKPPELDEGLIEARIEDFMQNYASAPWVEEILAGRSAEGAATAIREGSVLSDSASAVQAVEGGNVGPDDPAVAFVQAYVPAFGAFQGTYGALVSREEEVGRKVGRARFEVFGTSQPPDATFSLRIADGVVTPYEYNGTVAPVVTTLYGLYDRYYSFQSQYDEGDEYPWALPDRWLDPPEGLDLSTPVNFVSTADIIGGNSGSPVLNEFLDVVGLVFDGNIESLPGDYIYLPESNRSVAVDARGILEALDVVYDMDRVVLELTTGRLVATEDEADAVAR